MNDSITIRRIRESELITPLLSQLSKSPHGFAKTSDLIDYLSNLFQPSGEDASILNGRNDTKFSQKVRNLVSHRNDRNGIQTRGLVRYIREENGLQITKKGQRYLKTIH